MPDKDAATPRIYLIRHGATSWSDTGHFTGTTDLPSCPTARTANLAWVYVSPRKRARRTLELLFESAGQTVEGVDVDVRVTGDIAEWGYGQYEGLLMREIRELRRSRGLDGEREWDIWRDGTEGEGSETPGEVSERVDRVIGEITEMQGGYLRDLREGKLEEGRKRDVLVVAHGHVLRAFVKRWLGCDMGVKLELQIEPCGVAGLSYAGANVGQRAVLLGMSFPGARAGS